MARAAAAGGGALAATEYFEPPTVTWANGAHAAVVEVDRDTGEVRLLRYGVVHDCGRVINPLIVDGQVRGGVAQGIGGALYEELTYDEEGQLTSGTLADYLVPTAGEVPRIDLEHLETPSALNPLASEASARVAPSRVRPSSPTRSSTRCVAAGRRPVGGIPSSAGRR